MGDKKIKKIKYDQTQDVTVVTVMTRKKTFFFHIILFFIFIYFLIFFTTKKLHIKTQKNYKWAVTQQLKL